MDNTDKKAEGIAYWSVGKKIPTGKGTLYRVPIGDPEPTVVDRLKTCLPMVKNGMKSTEIWDIRGVIADAIDLLSK